MALRNLHHTHRHLMPAVASALSTVARRRRAEHAGLAMNGDPVMAVDAGEARLIGIRFVFDELVSRHRHDWVAGVPTRSDLEVLEKRTADHLGLSHAEVSTALSGHPRPQTCG